MESAVLASDTEQIADAISGSSGAASISIGEDNNGQTLQRVSTSPSGLDFAACYAKEMPGLVWFVMGLGADTHTAADVAQSAFAEAFQVWDRIQHHAAWLRRVAGRLYYRQMITQEALVDAVPDQRGSLSAVSAVELRDEARAVLAALADLPPKQRQVMAWSIDGFSPTEIADHLGVDSPSVRQNLAKARKHLKKRLGILQPGGEGSARRKQTNRSGLKTTT
jgi:RNA polymerase sigma factor (sigma-70 family)